MKIAVDARPLAFTGNGNARYLFDMLRAILPGKGLEFVLYSHRPIHNDYRSELSRLGATFRLDTSWTARLGLLFLTFRVPGWIKADRVDLYWGSLSILPLFYAWRVKVPSIVNFHDLNAYSAPETMTFSNRIQHRLTNGHTLRNANRILCLSQTTSNDIAARFPGVRSKLELIYPGIEQPTRSKATAPVGIGPLKSFFLMVGTIEPRKNQISAIAGYEAALKLSGTRGKLPALVVVGKNGWGSEDVYQKLKGGIMNVRYIERASDSELEWCYKNAALYVFPSLHEGFGLPILEAMIRGLNVLLSDIPIFREVAPDADFVAPLDVDGWRDAFLKFAKSKKKKAHLDLKKWSLKSRAQILANVIRSFE